MIKVAISLNKCDAAGQKSLVMSYLRNIPRSRISFDLIVDDDSNSIPFEEIDSLGGRVITIPPYQHILRHMFYLYRLYKKEKYDVLYATNNTMNIFPLFVAKLTGIKVRISESLSTASNYEVKKTIIKSILRLFSHLFCNYYMANGIKSAEYQFGKKTTDLGLVSLFYNPIEVEKYCYSPKERVTTRNKFEWNDKIVYGTIARFEKQKNPIFLIDVANEILKQQENAHFVIIGYGSMEDQMKSKIEQYGIGKRISWLGKREDLSLFYNAFDAFILPSLYEGFPIVGLEAQSTGLPSFFSSAVTREVSVENLSFFIELNKTAKEWADIIINGTSNLLKTQRKGRADFLRNNGFDAKQEASRLVSFFENAVKERSK